MKHRMKHKIIKKKAKRSSKVMFGNDGTYHNILVYFYKEVVINGFTFYIYTAKPKLRGCSGISYRYVVWLQSLRDFLKDKGYPVSSYRSY